MALPHFEWDTEPLNLGELTSKETLPIVARLGSPQDGLDWGSLLDWKKPLLMYSLRRRTKVYAECVSWNEKKKEFIKDGPLLEIPKDHTGWFEITPPDGMKAGFYGTIHGIAASGTKYFLVRRIAMGYRTSEVEGELKILGERKIYPGEILRVHKVCTKKWKTKKGSASASIEENSEETKEAESQFLKCLDAEKRELCLPLAHPGVFSVINTEKGERKPCSVYQLQDLFGVFDFPLLVRLVHGWPPKMEGTFTGILRLVESNRPDTVMAYSLDETSVGKSVLLELPTDIDATFKLAVNKSSYEKTTEYEKHRQTCSKHAYAFATGLKSLEVKYPVRAATSESESEPEENKFYTGLTSKPQDMTQFNPMDIFPSMEAMYTSESWPISFKDPDFEFDSEDEVASASGAETPTGSVGSGSSRGSRLLRMGMSKLLWVNKKRGSDASVTPSTNSISGTDDKIDKRASKIEEVMRREAKC